MMDRNTVDDKNRRFFDLREVPRLFQQPARSLRVLLLADDKHPANAVQDHIRSFSEYSSHSIAIVNTRFVRSAANYDPDDFDVLVIHYSIFILEQTYFPAEWQHFVENFMGVVSVIHEDEYQRVNEFRAAFKKLGVAAVFSCLDSVDTLEKVYSEELEIDSSFYFCCLPGYIPNSIFNLNYPPISNRTFHIVYRGRTLPPELGRFAQEKKLIGDQMTEIARSHGLRCDISSNENERIYGESWPLFLMSGKAMLGVEGGASIFDFEGAVKASVADFRGSNPDASFDEIWNAVLAPYEGNVEFRTITPKFFEAIAAGTALVLYPGRYNDILVADRHYIPLERDGSNADEVVRKLLDDDYLQKMADRTRAEVLYNPELNTRFYIEQIDRVLGTLSARNTVPRLKQSLSELSKRCSELYSAVRQAESERTAAREELDSLKQQVQLLQATVSSEGHFAEHFKKMLVSRLKRIVRAKQ